MEYETTTKRDQLCVFNQMFFFLIADEHVGIFNVTHDAVERMEGHWGGWLIV